MGCAWVLVLVGLTPDTLGAKIRARGEISDGP